jgi:hypothetical protein
MLDTVHILSLKITQSLVEINSVPLYPERSGGEHNVLCILERNNVC